MAPGSPGWVPVVHCWVGSHPQHEILRAWLHRRSSGIVTDDGSSDLRHVCSRCFQRDEQGRSAPVVAAIGLILWDTHWRGSIFALNLFKCLLATVLFASVILVTPCGLSHFVDAIDMASGGALCVSSLIGIVLGDTLWLTSVRLLGARRVLLIDSLKPFMAAAAGGLFFRERTTAAGFLGMSCALGGLLVVSLEAEAGRGLESKEDLLVRRRRRGYVLAVLTTLLDLGGSVLTKGFGEGLGPWEIGAVRFGFASVCLSAIAVARHVALALLRRRRHRVEDYQWHAMPRQSSKSWKRVVAGVVCVTFFCPALGNYALFAIPLGFCLTLGSLGPVLTIPIVWVMKRERSSLRSILGSSLAVAGVAIFCQSIIWQ